ncbi:MAG: ribonucleoside triphosphate reductase [Pseudomonas sp.]
MLGPLNAFSPQQLCKRDGRRVAFDLDKISQAIAAAADASGEFDPALSGELANAVLERLRDCSVEPVEVSESNAPSVNIEQVQDRVERVLMEAGYYDTARAYIVYRERHIRLRRDRKAIVEVASSMNEYLSREDWRVQANANQGYSLGGLVLNVSGKVTANYWLDEVYSEAIGLAHREADLHIHDLDMLAGYCAGWSLRTLLNEGLNGVPGRVEAGPPQHLSSALGQMVNFLGTLQNEWAGAQAFSSFDTYLAAYVRKDKLGFNEVRQAIQEFIYNLNVPSRWGTQTPFTNLTFDWVCPEDLREQVPVVGGVEMPFAYGDLQVEMDLINRAYIEVMQAGDAKGRVFTFPIPTYNITHDFPWDSENADRLFEMTARYGLPYFQNFLNSDMLPNQVRSMCCRLQLDVRELLKRGGGLFGSAEQTGSLGVVTINCARLGYLFKGDGAGSKGDVAGLLARLESLMELAMESLEVKRKVIQHHMDNGLYPYTKRYLGTLRNHFSTIGLNGMHEMLRNFTADQEGMHTPKGRELALQVLDHVRATLLRFQEETGQMYNLEATPAEGTTYRFAKEDRKRFADILQAGSDAAPYYTNSSQLPVGFTDDPFEALELQDALQCKYTGGTVLHLYMAERISSIEACKSLVRNALSRFRLPYLTVTPTFSICPVHGYLDGEQEFCPKCDDVLLQRQQAKCG